MKSYTRTVLDDTLSSAASYSSGPLDVGDLYELAIDFNVTAVVGGVDGEDNPQIHMHISRIGSDGNLYPLATVDLPSVETQSTSIGAGLTVNSSFGDQIQLDLSIASGTHNVTTTVSIKGKG